MTAMPFATLRPSGDDRVVAGVCAGIAKEIGVEPATPEEARTILKLKGIGKVNY